MSKPKYKILAGDSTIELAQQVNQSINEGYAVQGGVAIINGRPGDMSSIRFIQAVTLPTPQQNH